MGLPFGMLLMAVWVTFKLYLTKGNVPRFCLRFSPKHFVIFKYLYGIFHVGQSFMYTYII
jgi:hypothetical protein